MPCGGERAATEERDRQIASAKARRSRQPGERGERRQQVDVLHRDPSPGVRPTARAGSRMIHGTRMTSS